MAGEKAPAIFVGLTTPCNGHRDVNELAIVNSTSKMCRCYMHFYPEFPSITEGHSLRKKEISCKKIAYFRSAGLVGMPDHHDKVSYFTENTVKKMPLVIAGLLHVAHEFVLYFQAFYFDPEFRGFPLIVLWMEPE
jgi:hypothetical protein